MRRLAVFSTGLSVALAGGAAAACPSCPAPVRDIVMERYYADAAGSAVDADKKRAKDEATAPLKAFRDAISDSADAAVVFHSSGKVPSGSSGLSAKCAVSWLADWARGGALLGRMSSKQAEAQRRFELAGLALAYIKLIPDASSEDRAAIEPWLVVVADKARAVFEDTGIKRNNHWYWMGLGLGAVGHATGSKRHLDAAREIMRDAARDIAPNGTLPLELARGGRALHYHGFAAMALAPLAEIGAAHGEDWYQLNDGALHRLIHVTSLGLADPSVFDRAAGSLQQRPPAAHAGFLHLYRSRFPTRLPGVNLPTRQSPSHLYLGGDVALLRSALGLPKTSPVDTKADVHTPARQLR
ncbi:MAG: alginate lyase family protein [Hyphomicrobiaceae bacterium]|nr:alginate lyase family protein [Hyphomicrobiaceae bacterium]